MMPLPPVWGAEARDLGAVAAAVGLKTEDLHPEWRPQVAATGVRHLLVAATSGAAVARAAPDHSRLGPLLAGVDANAVYLFASTPEGAKARRFDRSAQMGEDPATGSAAGPVGIYLAMRGAAGMPAVAGATPGIAAATPWRIAIHQGEEVGRPSVLHVEVRRQGDGWSAVVEGGVYIVGEGAFSIG
jgi:PhzF family phenazine biosynthesis protein